MEDEIKFRSDFRVSLDEKFTYRANPSSRFVSTAAAGLDKTGVNV